jgi:CheY-like chemotaxis protein
VTDSTRAETPERCIQKPIILVVEDEVLVRLMVGESLREQGFFVIEAANADEAITVLGSATPIDLVLTDIEMPGTTNGIGLARFIRSAFPRLKIVLTSAYAISAADGGAADAFIRKPFNVAEITRQIRDLTGA